MTHLAPSRDFDARLRALRAVRRTDSAEHLVRIFAATLTPEQCTEICLPWDAADHRGAVRNFIANHWQITRPTIRSAFFTPDQQALIWRIFCALIAPDWRERIAGQLLDDTNGHPWGQDQSVGLFGDPETGPFQFVLCGRHLTLRAGDGSGGRAAFGGPIVYGHAATGFHEQPHHPGNIFWPHALAATRLYDALPPQLQAAAAIDRLPPEHAIGFDTVMTGASVAAFDVRARDLFASLLGDILAPFRPEDGDAVRRCIAAQGGIDALRIAYGRHGRISAPAWDDWRIQGPAFVWHFRGAPHVHAWVHVADRPYGPVNARPGMFIHDGQDRLW